ncbi:MAG: glycosyltransferase [Acidocella sp.]|nr:glycosyltransferase [Acidocella sp.]
MFYKRVDIAIRAFNASGRRLVVVGQGEQDADLRKIAGPNVVFLGRQPHDKVMELLSTCRALVFPGLEDFGIIPLEAMASGRPVIAYGAGGALETVIDGKTGILFTPQTPEALEQAVVRFEDIERDFEPMTLRDYAKQFDKAVFKSRLQAFIDDHMSQDVSPMGALP